MRRHLSLVAAAFTGLVTAASTVGGCSGDDIEFPVPEKPREFKPAAGGVRVLLMPQYINSVRYLLGDGAAAAAINIDLLPDDQQVQGYYAVGAAFTPPGQSYPELWDLTAAAVASATLADPGRLAEWVPCISAGPQDDACYDSFAEQFGRVAFRRPVLDTEKTWITGIAKQARAWGDGDFMTGVEWAIRGMLQSPSFLYIAEVGESDPDNAGRRVLNPYELATRMSFFLTDTTPDDTLLDAAEAGTLTDAEVMKGQARRLLATPAARVSVRTRFAEILYLDRVRSAQKSADLYPGFDDVVRDSMVREVELLLDDIIFERKADVRELYTADYTFVNDTLAGLYGMSAPASEWQKVSWPAEQNRAGYLSMGAFLARAGHSVTTSPTKRGTFVLDRVLCGVVPPPEPGANTTLPQPAPGDPPMTAKQIAEQHMEKPSCANCHATFDPFGYAMENFDTIGRYRTTDAGQPVDSTGVIDGFGEFASPRELAALLIADERQRVSQCIMLNVFRSSLGHIETDDEEPALTALHTVFGEAGFDLQELMVEMTVNPAFQYVAELPEDTQ